MEPPVAVEVDADSVLLMWHAVKDSLQYELLMHTLSDIDTDTDTDTQTYTHKDIHTGDSHTHTLDTHTYTTDDIGWTILSSSIKSTTIRKKSLLNNAEYRFRIRCKFSYGWDVLSAAGPPVRTRGKLVVALPPPMLQGKDAVSVTLQWVPETEVGAGGGGGGGAGAGGGVGAGGGGGGRAGECAGSEDKGERIGYRLRYRSEQDMAWTEIDTVVASTSVRKKGLLPGVGYYFAVKPVATATATALSPREASKGHGMALGGDGTAPPAPPAPYALLTPLTPPLVWAYSRAAGPFKAAELSTAVLHPTAPGYTTSQGRVDWLTAHNVTSPEDIKRISSSLDADRNLDSPLYYWQLYSLLGMDRVETLVTAFYTRVYADKEEPWFRQAFERISPMDHHIATQSAFWADAFGGGKRYHGSDGRLNFHHSENAAEVMNERGAERWMHHMRMALGEQKTAIDRLDRRIMPCLVDFLKTKMYKYSHIHSWKFDPTDFDHLIRPIALP
jgi:truncated hemoglobin YjbI